MNPTHVLIHYGEVALKKGNRGFFERKLRENIKDALGKTLATSVQVYRGRFLVVLQEDADFPTVKSILQKIPGIAYFAPAYTSEPDMDTLKEDSLALMKELEFTRFRVSCRRAQKRLPFNSMDVQREVGGFLLHHLDDKEVNLDEPEIDCSIELFDDQAIIFVERIEGLRGLPVGTTGKVVSLISAGIDSPVASYQMIRKGCTVCYVHFHSYPFTDKNSIYNSIRLVKVLNEYQRYSRVHLISLAKIQERIIALAPVKLRLILYRRMMFRLAEMVAHRQKAKALITGESLGQVASQTLANLRATTDAVNLPILRPLIGYDKLDIINLAKEIGTYEISIEPFQDCCTYMVPKHPETFARLPEVKEAEDGLGDWEELLHQAMRNAEIEKIRI